MPLSFNDLKAHYPTMSKHDLYASLGGQWPGLENNPSYQNTCCVRISVAILASGGTIPSKYKEGIAGDGRPLIIRVASMGQYLQATFGTPFWGMSKNPGTPIDEHTLPQEHGIIAYHVHWSDATGHVDLWDTPNFVGSGNFDQIKDGFEIALWKFD